MIKYIGMALILIGAALLALVLYREKKEDLKGAEEELTLILGEGYATTHTAAASARSILEKAPVKVPPRKRALSREAAEILKKVEEERQAEKAGTSVSGPM